VSDRNGQNLFTPPDVPTRYPRRRWAVVFLFAAAAVVAAVLTAGDSLSEHIVSVALIVAAIVSIYLLYDSLVRSRRKLEQLGRSHLMYEAARRFSGTLVADEIYDGLRELAGRGMPIDGMVVSSYDPGSSVVRCVYGWVAGKRFDSASLPPLTIDIRRPGGMQTEVIRTGECRLYGDVEERVKRPGGRYYDVGPGGSVRDLKRPGAKPPGAKCAVMAPVKLEGQVVGVVQVMSDTPRAYTPEHLEILRSLVTPMAVALQNAELFARARREIAERMRVEGALKHSEELLREADRRKDEFLAMLAHELRNPLAPIRNAVDVLRTNPEKMGYCQDVIERQTRHMARLLDDLLDVSLISRGALNVRKERVRLAEVIQHATEASHPLIVAGGHHLTTTLPSEPILLDADATRLAQVVSNLLNNAARYSEPGSRIRVDVERVGRDALVRVRDNGVGMRPDMLEQVFEPFFQIDRSLDRSQGGLGIGLTLVKRIVEFHGGTVEARSEGLGKGCEFIVRLPVAESALAPSAGMPEVEGEVGMVPRSRILVVDDLRDSADSLAMMLRAKGHDVRTAYDGYEAVEIALDYRPDVVLLDIGMPRLNGFDAARMIREQSVGDSPMLIAVTGWGHDENRLRTKEAGFDHHLVKPVEPAVLTRLLAERWEGARDTR
jgi:signal transduction histidine kinase/ActR/RegA family two-component response regulator